MILMRSESEVAIIGFKQNAMLACQDAEAACTRRTHATVRPDGDWRQWRKSGCWLVWCWSFDGGVDVKDNNSKILS